MGRNIIGRAVALFSQVERPVLSGYGLTKKKSKWLLAAAMICAAPAFAAEDKSAEFQDFFMTRFVGRSSAASRTWDNTFCIATNPIGGSCIEKGGFVVNGEASGAVDALVSQSGHGVLLEKDVDPWTGAVSPYMRMQQEFVFHYSGESSGAKNCFPGNFMCDNPWGSEHPTGNIYVNIIANKPTGFVIKMRYDVMPGHDDRPNQLLRMAMANLKDAAVQIVKTYQEANGCQQSITINEGE